MKSPPHAATGIDPACGLAPLDVTTAPRFAALMDSRLVDLEVRYTYLERSLGELNGVVLSLRAEIDRLRRELTELRHGMIAGLEGPPAAEKPPHY